MTIGNHYSVFTKDEFHYCVSIDHVREVIRTDRLIAAPIPVVGFLGFLDFRKALCPVLDIASLLRLDRPAAFEGPFTLMVLEKESTLFAVLIDRFVESLELDNDTAERTDTGRLLVDQVYRYDGKALNRIDLMFLKTFVQDHIHDQLRKQTLLTPVEGPPEDRGAEIEMICFGLDHLRFGIPISDLVEVIEGFSVEPLFRTNRFLRGLINLQGQIIACVDLSEAIGLPSRRMEEKNQYILLQHDDQDLALCIDTISKKEKFQVSRILNVGHIFSGELSDYLMGIIETGQDRIFVLSGPKIFASKYLVPYQE